MNTKLQTTLTQNRTAANNISNYTSLVDNTIKGVAVNVVACVLVLTVSKAALADEAIVIGGGYNLLSSQGQIELNVQYARESLQDKGIDVTTFFTDGGEPGHDVFAQHQEPLDATYEPISRVFGDYLEMHREYRSSTLKDVAGSTRRDTLLPELQQHLANADEPLWLLYNGHGNQSTSTTDQVTLELWDETRITAEELHDALSVTTQPVRYAFTQCYSGGFHALAYEEPHGTLKPASPQRCGFTAVSAYSMSEGCSASINTNDYRDYTTHFFAALSGYDRNDRIIVTDPDTNSDGDVSPREAHLYSLLNANSTDISRATSEDFLERWEPWYLKWTPGVRDLPANEYAKLFRKLASNLNVPLDQNSIGTIRAKLDDFKSNHADIQTQIDKLKQNIKLMRRQIAQPIITRWPDVLGPYSVGYQTLAANGELTAVTKAISADPQYTALVESQDTIATLEIDQLDLQRQATNHQKLLHLRRLATLRQQLVDFGSSTDIQTYENFVQCESMPMNSEPLSSTFAEQ